MMNFYPIALLALWTLLIGPVVSAPSSDGAVKETKIEWREIIEASSMCGHE